ncbi:hypothetical protein pb186bvf_017477 [Paramecium bursaria]
MLNFQVEFLKSSIQLDECNFIWIADHQLTILGTVRDQFLLCYEYRPFSVILGPDYNFSLNIIAIRSDNDQINILNGNYRLGCLEIIKTKFYEKFEYLKKYIIFKLQMIESQQYPNSLLFFK